METSTRRMRVLIAKTSLDGHLRGVVTVAQALRDGGMEVIYLGQLTSAQILQAAMQEDVDVIGLNIGGRLGHVAELMQTLKDKGMSNILVVAGGPILKEDIPELKEMGIAEVFPTGSRLENIVTYIVQNAPPK
ncbi:MAG: cobalamin-dependent protein [Dehalococcoidia bacterium]|nr:cobalamin-dependent protein [Dehalococcoidia bacterium]